MSQVVAIQRPALRLSEVQRRKAALQRYLRDSALDTPGMIAAGVSSTPAVIVSSTSPDDYQTAAVAKAPAAFLPGVYCVVSYEFARRWARENGILEARKALDVRAVNAIRKTRGLPPFALKGEC